MRCIVINLPVAWERREAIDHEFRKVGLEYELWPAVDGHSLTDSDRAAIDRRTRARLGLRPMDDSSIACLMSHLAIFRHLVESADEMVAVFEDDARFHYTLPDVLDALEGKSGKFDVVKLQRLKPLPYFPVYQLGAHSLGRVRYHDAGAYGYVITRTAAAHLLERFPHPVHEIDWIIPRFWDNGLRNVLYVNPPVVAHDDMLPSYIDGKRLRVRAQHHQRMITYPSLMARRLCAGAQRRWHRWRGFRELRRQDRDIDPFGF